MCLSALLLYLATVPVVAHDVIPEYEKHAAQRLLAEGPKETRGVESAIEIGSVPLDGELRGGEGKVLRARLLMLAPGAQIAVHEHQQRPGGAPLRAAGRTDRAPQRCRWPDQAGRGRRGIQMHRRRPLVEERDRPAGARTSGGRRGRGAALTGGVRRAPRACMESSRGAVACSKPSRHRRVPPCAA